MLRDFRAFRSYGFGRRRSFILAFWELPIFRNL